MFKVILFSERTKANSLVIASQQRVRTNIEEREIPNYHIIN